MNRYGELDHGGVLKTNCEQKMSCFVCPHGMDRKSTTAVARLFRVARACGNLFPQCGACTETSRLVADEIHKLLADESVMKEVDVVAMCGRIETTKSVRPCE
jgi:hypothetical protein